MPASVRNMIEAVIPTAATAWTDSVLLGSTLGVLVGVHVATQKLGLVMAKDAMVSATLAIHSDHSESAPHHHWMVVLVRTFEGIELDHVTTQGLSV